MDKPNFAKGGGLIPAIAQDAASGEVLMLAYMNEDAWNDVLKTGEGITTAAAGIVCGTRVAHRDTCRRWCPSPWIATRTRFW